MSNILSSVPKHMLDRPRISTEHKHTIEAVLDSWNTQGDERPAKLAILLQHRYETFIEGKNCIPTLMNWDAYVYSLLVSIARDRGFSVGFCTLQHKLTGPGYDLDHPKNLASGYRSDDADEALETYVCNHKNLDLHESESESMTSLKNVVDLRGHRLKEELPYDRHKEGIYHHVFVSAHRDDWCGQMIEGDDPDEVGAL